MASMIGQVALVTGAASGIGRALALKLGAAGARLVLGDVREASLAELADELRSKGAEVATSIMDVTREADVARTVKLAEESFGRLTLAVNNAGTGQPPEPLYRLSTTQWQRTVDVNLTSVFLCLKYEIPAMMAAGGGAIVNMASALGIIGEANSSAYVAAKHGVVGLTKAAAIECADKGVRITAVCPGMTETPLLADLPPEGRRYFEKLHPLKRFATPTEVADLAFFLLSPEASFITGSHHLVDGGWSAR